MTSLVGIEDLTVAFDGALVLHGVNLTVRRSGWSASPAPENPSPGSQHSACCRGARASQEG